MTKALLLSWNACQYFIQHTIAVVWKWLSEFFDRSQQSEFQAAQEHFFEESYGVAVYICKQYALQCLQPSAQLTVSRKEIVVIEENRALSSYFTLRFFGTQERGARVQDEVILRVIQETTDKYPGFTALYDQQQFMVQCWYR